MVFVILLLGMLQQDLIIIRSFRGQKIGRRVMGKMFGAAGRRAEP